MASTEDTFAILKTLKTVELEQRIQKMEDFCQGMAQKHDSLVAILQRLQRLERKL